MPSPYSSLFDDPLLGEAVRHLADARPGDIATASDGETQVSLGRGPAMIMAWKPPAERFEVDPRASTEGSPADNNHLFADLLVPVGAKLKRRAAAGEQVLPFVFVTDTEGRGVTHSQTKTAHFFYIGETYHHDDVLRALAPALREQRLTLSDWGDWAPRLRDIADVFVPYEGP
jgi:hypothetical protein